MQRSHGPDWGTLLSGMRRTLRVPLSRKPAVTFGFRGSSAAGELFEARCLDLSPQGCCLESALPKWVLEADGPHLGLCLNLPGAEPIVADAVVRWIEGNRFGVEFTRVSQAHADALRSALIRLQLEAQRQRRQSRPRRRPAPPLPTRQRSPRGRVRTAS